jgi:hypothetical protein
MFRQVQTQKMIEPKILPKVGDFIILVFQIVKQASFQPSSQFSPGKQIEPGVLGTGQKNPLLNFPSQLAVHPGVPLILA